MTNQSRQLPDLAAPRFGRASAGRRRQRSRVYSTTPAWRFKSRAVDAVRTPRSLSCRRRKGRFCARRAPRKSSARSGRAAEIKAVRRSSAVTPVQPAVLRWRRRVPPRNRPACSAELVTLAKRRLILSESAGRCLIQQLGYSRNDGSSRSRRVRASEASRAGLKRR